MIRIRHFLAATLGNARGSVTIETAIVAPLLVLMALGTFDASSMVARQSELQSASAEALAIVQANPPTDAAGRTVVRNVIEASTGLGNANVSVAEIYRCGTAAAFVTINNCGTGVDVSTFIKVTLTDTYTPMWTQFGISEPVDYNVIRTVQIS